MVKLRANDMDKRDDQKVLELVQEVIKQRSLGHEIRIEIDEEIRVYYTENAGKKSATEHRFYQNGKLVNQYCEETIHFLSQL